jgi:predicted nucleic acid-binding protein
MRPGEEPETRAFLDAFDVIPVSREIAWQAGDFIREYARRGVTLDFVDATIAATCLRHRLGLATYNVRHFPMPLRHSAAPS